MIHANLISMLQIYKRFHLRILKIFINICGLFTVIILSPVLLSRMLNKNSESKFVLKIIIINTMIIIMIIRHIAVVLSGYIS